MIRKNYSSGAPLEEVAGYSRAVEFGPFVYVGGTTSVQPDGSVYGENDSYAQVKYVLEKQLSFVEKAGGCKEDVYQIKMYVTPDFDSKKGFDAYAEIFREVKPLCTAVTITALNRPAQLVEIEMNAVIGSSKGAVWEGISLERTNYSSGSPLEDVLGYSRMVKIGPFVFVGGTTSVLPDGSVAGEEDAVAQDNFILKKELEMLAKAGAVPADVIKTKMYQTPEYKKYNKGGESYYAEVLKPVKPLCTAVTIEKLNRPAQLVETEMMAIVGCGGDEILPEWGNIDFRRTNISSGAPLEDSFGYSRIVKAGPFVFCGGTTSVQPDGTVACEENAAGQQSYVYEKLMKLIEPFGVKAEDVIKVKTYITPDFKKYNKPDEDSYYARNFKPVKPLNTMVTIHSLNRPTQLAEIEMFAVQGCSLEK